MTSGSLSTPSTQDRAVFEAALMGAEDAIFIAELVGDDLESARVVFVNDAFVAVTGRSVEASVGRGPASLLAVSTSLSLTEAPAEHLLRRHDGRPYWAEVSIRVISGVGGADHVIGTVRDVDDRHHADERLAHAASHDALTGLPNRLMLFDRLERALQRSRPTGSGVAVLFVDLDNFKLVNDSLGHDYGDAVLCEVAARLEACAGPDDTVGRFGGDEMVVVHAGPSADAASSVALGERILAALGEPMEIVGRELVMSASIGLASSGADRPTAEQLIRDADTALYAAKQRGRARLEVFSDELYQRVANRVRIEADLRVALREDQLFVEYQPQVDLESGRLVGVEALVRWRHPDRGIVPPDQFITVAEECGLIVALGRQVLEASCQQLAEWTRTLATPPPSVTVNVSLRQLDDPQFVDDVAMIVADSGIPPTSLTLELTESALVNSDANVVGVLTRLRAIGIYLAIDDFGTEYSSLARLRDLPVEVLKIDRTFVDGLGTESGDTAIVASIMSLAFAMGLHVIAEGVETPAQATALAELGCGVAQGFLFSASVSPSEVARLSGRRFRRAHSAVATVPTTTTADDGDIRSTAPRRGRRYFVDEFLDHIGAPMDDALPPGSDAS